MPKLIRADYDVQYLLPPAMEDWVGEDHPARFVRELVESLDLDKEGFMLPDASDENGRPAYAPELLLSAWVYGYMRRIRSSRRLEEAVRDEMGFIWLCGGHTPDHNTLWRFWKTNREALRAVFNLTVKVAMKLGLVGLAVQAIDGTKLPSRSSGGWGRGELEQALAGLDAQIVQLEQELEASGQAQEELERQLPSAELGALTRAGQLRGAVAAALDQVKAGRAKHVHPLEPEAVRVKLARGGTPFGYNAQAVVDGHEHIITAAEVHAVADDTHLAQTMMELACAHTEGGSAKAQNLADGGYSCSEAHRRAQESGQNLLTPLRRNAANPEDKPFHASKFRHDPATDTVHCPGGQDLPYVRTRSKDGLPVRVYRSKQACAHCPVRQHCTRSHKNIARTIELAPGHAAVEALRQKLADPHQRALLARRGSIVEPVFGWIKTQDGFQRFTAAGLDNARTQWSLVCAARNLRTLYKTWRQTRSQSPMPPALQSILPC